MSKGNPLLSVRIPPNLNQLIEQKCLATGESRSEVAISALTNYLQPASEDDELAQLKRRLQKVEMAVQSLQRGE